MAELDFRAIETKWQGRWQDAELFRVFEHSTKPKYYVLEMFPYPSGDGLHMGHALNYTIGDVLARFKRMQGYNVLYPMGYDALGLPAENAAIKKGVHPQEYTNRAIAHYVRQQQRLGLSYDWKRIINTADPLYYRWDQWIFLQLFHKGLAYQKKSRVNFCPDCNTVLANEQVHNGHCWRHEETSVVIKELKQWFLKITDYADELYESIDTLQGWPEKTKAMQKNWIGKSHGTEITFTINEEPWHIFTTRPDTIFGVTFMVVAAQHPRLMDLVTPEQTHAVEAFVQTITSVSEKTQGEDDALNKSGVFTGSYAINPATHEKIPVYAGNFVVADYGSGMVMGVPAHDKRDFSFAKQYNLEIKPVVAGGTPDGAYTDSGVLINSGEFDGLDNEAAKEQIAAWLTTRGCARKVVNFRLRDWGISRQRYWGTPIPIIHCDACGVVAVPESDLPVALPMDVTFGEGNPLLTATDWLNVSCPSCGKAARRETDTMDTFVNSSWYFLRYTDPLNTAQIFDSKNANYWCPVDQYIGGYEHACMHLIYVRFYTKFLADLGRINFREPAVNLFHQGVLHGEGGIKMSKSKGNVVNPDVVSETYGIDTARYFLLSLAEPDKPRDWSESGIQGSLRFITRLVEAVTTHTNGTTSPQLRSLLHETIEGVTEDITTFRYRMATIKLKALFEAIGTEKTISTADLHTALKLLSPICPHIAEELWEQTGGTGFISISSWPKHDPSKIIKADTTLDLTQKTITLIKDIFLKVGEKENIYIYVMPFERAQLDQKTIADATQKQVHISAVNDPEKHDPEGKAKKAKPGMPSIYVSDS